MLRVSPQGRPEDDPGEKPLSYGAFAPSVSGLPRRGARRLLGLSSGPSVYVVLHLRLSGSGVALEL